MSPDRVTARAAAVELLDRGDPRMTEAYMRTAANYERAMLAAAADAAEASRRRRQAAREAQKRAAAELQHELEAPLIEGVKR